MLPGSSIFLRWAGPPLDLEDPRLDSAALDDPDTIASVCRWPVRVTSGPAEALQIARDRLCPDALRRRIVVCGGESPEILAAIDVGFRRPGDELVLVPPNADGAAEVESIAMALGGIPRGRAVVIAGAVTATGAVAPIAETATVCAAHRAGLVLDLTLARFTALPATFDLHHAGFAALDRWDGEPAGTWGVALDGLPAWAEAAPAGLQHLDAALRGTLACHPSITVWPLAARRRAVGVVGFTIAEWSAEEAAELFSQAFGVILEAGRLTAAPLPFPERIGRGLLRVSIAPSTTSDEIAALGTAVSRLAQSRTPTAIAH